MKNNFKKWGLAMLVCLSIASCKKDKASEQPGEDAKTWYIRNTQKSSYAMVSNKNQLRMVSQTVNWDGAQTYTLDDGTVTVGVPVTITQSNGASAKGSYMLLISKTEKGFKKQTVYNGEDQYFKTITKNKVQSAFELGNHLSALNKRANSNPSRGKIMSDEIGGGEGESPVCTDWYLIETVRDADGNVVAVFETFLFQTCTSPGGGGGGGGGNNDGSDVQIDMGYPVSEDEGHSEEETMTEDGDLLKVSNLKWKFHNAGIYRCVSTERGAVKVTGSGRVWHSLVHQSASKVGSTYFFTVALTKATAVPSISPHTATMTMKYTLKFNVSAGVYNSEHDTDEMSSFASWDENFVKLANN